MKLAALALVVAGCAQQSPVDVVALEQRVARLEALLAPAPVVEQPTDPVIEPPQSEPVVDPWDAPESVVTAPPATSFDEYTSTTTIDGTTTIIERPWKNRSRSRMCWRLSASEGPGKSFEVRIAIRGQNRTDGDWIERDYVRWTDSAEPWHWEDLNGGSFAFITVPDRKLRQRGTEPLVVRVHALLEWDEVTIPAAAFDELEELSAKALPDSDSRKLAFGR